MGAALIIPQNRGFFRTSVCGLPILTRAVCAFGRSLDTVYILKTPEVPEGYPDELEHELAIRTTKPRVIWLAPGGALPIASGLFVMWQPGVFDYRLCAELLRLPQTAKQIVRCRRPREAEALLWYVGKERCAEVARSLTSGATSMSDLLLAQATDDYDPGERLCDPVLDETARRAVERTLFAGTRKPTDTWIARHFDRYVSNWFTRRLLPLPITPNQVTLISFALGLVGALLILAGMHAVTIIGAVLLVLCIIIDGCDGEIARLKFMDTPSGRKLDFVLDNIVNAAALFAIGAGYYLQSGERFFFYAPLFNATVALACAFPVYFLFYEKDVDPSASADSTSLRAQITQAVMGRDFMYGILFLALFNRAHWFVYLTLGGIGFFFVSVVVMTITRRLDRRPEQAQAARAATSQPLPPLPAASAYRSVDAVSRGHRGGTPGFPAAK
jgi:phosphatidylglycerophosphate synthase